MILSNIKKRIFTSIVLLALVLLTIKYNFILVYFLIILGVLSIIEFISLTKKIILKKFYLSAINLIFIVYTFAFCYLFIFFSSFTGLKLILYILLFGCIASDTGGYIFGKILKGPKLIKISPNKTYSGLVGSIILTLITVSCLFYYFINVFNFKIMIIALMTSIFCQLGDLFFSYLKRKAKSKDTGTLLPGHGGVLDRLDGIFVGVPIGFLTLVLIN